MRGCGLSAALCFMWENCGWQRGGLDAASGGQ
jgi:hypothetical protein